MPSVAAGIIFPEPEKEGRATVELYSDDDVLFGRALVAMQNRLRSSGLPSIEAQAAAAERELSADVRRRRAARRRRTAKTT